MSSLIQFSDFDGCDDFIAAYKRSIAPRPKLTVSEWADKYRRLPSSSPEPGKWYTSRTPYLREIMDRLSLYDRTKRVVFMKGSQIGGTEAMNNFLGYKIHYDPAPIMVILASQKLAMRVAKQRIRPLYEETPVLRSLLQDKKGSNTITEKIFEGGSLSLVGSTSSNDLRSTPAEVICGDELEGWPVNVDDEGSPTLLAERRCTNYPNSKVFYISTPKLQKSSAIHKQYLRGDQRHFHVPCPYCEHKQPIEFDRFEWEAGKPETVQMRCENKACNKLIAEGAKETMLPAGEWVSTADGDGITASYWLSSLYSPKGWFSWEEAARVFDLSKEDHSLRPGFYNTILGLPFEGEDESPDWHRLYERREDYPVGSIPSGVLFLTAGVDVQNDRVEYEVVGWGRDGESWSIEYMPFKGNPYLPDVWQELDDLLAGTWTHPSGIELPIRVMCVDSGFASSEVYKWARRHPQAIWSPAGAFAKNPRTVVATKGKSRKEQDIALIHGVSSSDTIRKRWGLDVWTIGVSMAKSELYGKLKLNRPSDEVLNIGDGYPPGYCHFPQYSEEYFRQLTAERLTIKIDRAGYAYPAWEKQANQANEALDCRVYARAGAAIYGMDRFNDDTWDKFEAALHVPDIKDSQKQTKDTHSSDRRRFIDRSRIRSRLGRRR